MGGLHSAKQQGGTDSPVRRLYSTTHSQMYRSWCKYCSPPGKSAEPLAYSGAETGTPEYQGRPGQLPGGNQDGG